mgnify:CR=1 FL=1
MWKSKGNRAGGCLFLLRGDINEKMRTVELCMKYSECKFCPRNKWCEAEEKKYDKAKRKDRNEKRKFKRGHYE